MALNTELNQTQMQQFVGLLHQSLKIRSRCEFLLWSQGEVQQFIPHDVMLTAWGDFSAGDFQFEIVSASPDMRTEDSSEANHEEIRPFLARMFEYWKDHLESPFVIRMDDGVMPKGTAGLNVKKPFANLKSALVHAIKDQRGKHDCLYVLLSASNIQPNFSRTMLEAFLPYIDHSLRQLDQQQAHETVASRTSIASVTSPLSDREMEIMQWVMNGKTNFEIGMILNISVFTVKNHLQRIFRKLDVISRAQAVAKLSQRPEIHATH